eukprot:13355605-Heterocapsa_arctica.AAC.1
MITVQRVQRAVAPAGRHDLGRVHVFGESVAITGLLTTLTDRRFGTEALVQGLDAFYLPATPLPGPPPI